MELEALAINYLIQSAWAWIAFLTAALSFWKIKSSIHSHHRHNISPKISSPSPSPSPSLSPSTPQPPPPLPSPSQPPQLQTSSTTFCLLENRRSGKFSVYYGEDAVDIGRKEGRKTIRHNNQLGDGWEALINLKTTEMGWHRYQDLTVLDGSVVRLWNHHVVYY